MGAEETWPANHHMSKETEVYRVSETADDCEVGGTDQVAELQRDFSDPWSPWQVMQRAPGLQLM